MTKNELTESLVDPETGLDESEQHFLDILFDQCKGNVREAMTLSGYPKNTPTSKVTKKLKTQIQELSKAYLAINTAKASIHLVSILDDPNMIGAKNVIATAKEILDRGGVFKEEDSVKQIERNIFYLPPLDSGNDPE